MKKTFIQLLTLLFFISLIGESTLAIPAFARKYRMSCQTCHSPIPKLKAYGDEFAGNGFVLADQDAPRYFVDTGDPMLSLIRDFPIAVRLDAHVTYRNDDNTNKADLSTPYLLKLLSGGALADNLAYYFYFYMNEHGEIAGVEDAYLMFNNLFDIDFDLYVGQFQISDPLFKRELRLTLEDYQIYKSKIGLSNANLAYDRGFMLTLGLESGTDIIFEMVNGNGLSDDALDSDKYKNFFGRVSQDVGEFLRVGAFGYLGKEDLENFDAATNELTMFGGDATIGLHDVLELNLQYVYRKDKHEFPDGPVGSVEYKTNGGLAELIFTPNGDESKWYAVGLFNLVDCDDDAFDYQSVAVHAGYLLRRNLRLVCEFRRDIENEFNLFSLGFVSAF